MAKCCCVICGSGHLVAGIRRDREDPVDLMDRKGLVDRIDREDLIE